MEHTRSIKIQIVIDTNKATYRHEFDDFSELVAWLEENGYIEHEPYLPRMDEEEMN